MTDNKILCSADEYAWLEDGLRIAKNAYEFIKNKAKPGSIAAASADKKKASIQLYEIALDHFAIRPGSTRSESGEMILSREFGNEFSKLPGAKLNLGAIVVDENKISASDVD